MAAEVTQEIASSTDDISNHDPVSNPHHYKRFPIEPFRFISENKLEFWQGNVIKYILRHDAKNGLEDMKKARRCLDMQIAKMEGKDEWWT